MAEGHCCGCNGKNEKKEKLDKILLEYGNEKGNLMKVLEEAQEVYGYLPREVQMEISDKMDIPLAEIYGVITFYSRFSLEPKGKYNIAVCLGTACYVKGSGDILEKLKDKLKINVDECTPDGKYSLEATRCIGACGLAPVLSVNGEVYGKLTVNNVDEILEKYKD